MIDAATVDERSRRGERVEEVALVVAALLLFGAAWIVIASRFPWRPAFDDFDHLPAAMTWARDWRLVGDGIFLRVPLWPVLLGTVAALTGPRAAVIVVQTLVVAGALIAYVVAARPLRDALPPWLWGLPALVFAASPQVVLYARHAVNEPLVGVLAAWVVLLSRRAARRHALVLGLLCGAAAMTKIVAAVLVLPALAALVAGADDGGRSRLRGLGLFAGGIAAVVAPFVALHLAQRGAVLIDTTGAFNLSRYTPREWMALGDQMTRYRAGMADFRQTIAADPAGYLTGFAGRLARWIWRPSSADFTLFFKGYPHALIQALDRMTLGLLALAAAAGTRRRDLWTWTVVAAIAVACTFPRHTPYTPKVILIYPLLMLAPSGLARVWRVATGGRAIADGGAS